MPRISLKKYNPPFGQVILNILKIISFSFIDTQYLIPCQTHGAGTCFLLTSKMTEKIFKSGPL